MVELPMLTVIPVTLAAVLYCGEKLAGMMSQFVTERILQRLNDLEELRKKTYREIQTEFDFWWSGSPQETVRQALLERLPFPPEFIESLPSGMPEGLARQAEDVYRELALHLAIHVRMSKSERTIIDALPNRYKVRDEIVASHAEHESELERARTELVSVGVNIVELEEQFTSE